MTTSKITEDSKILFHGSLVCISLVWLGMILGISFLEAPLKFMAPSVTPEIGLGIGRQVFGVFNKIECAMALAMIILIVICRQKDRLIIPMGVVWSALALQTFWLLPVLYTRVELILQGQTPAPSPVHSIYVILEISKAVALAVYGFRKIRTVVKY
jgi:hypothetical protein